VGALYFLGRIFHFNPAAAAVCYYFIKKELYTDRADVQAVYNMVLKSLALFSLALVVIAGMIMASACTGTGTPTVTPSATPLAATSGAPSASPLPLSNNSTAAFTQSDNNRTVNITSGKNFTVTLEENPSTGYAWNASVTSGLTIVNDTYLPPNTSLLGAPDPHEWRILATGTGEQRFSATYKRPNEPLVGNETTYVLKVIV
jgi:inhibitor of cysteine peptidase